MSCESINKVYLNYFDNVVWWQCITSSQKIKKRKGSDVVSRRTTTKIVAISIITKINSIDQKNRTLAVKFFNSCKKTEKLSFQPALMPAAPSSKVTKK